MIKRHSKLFYIFALVLIAILPIIGRVFLAGEGFPPDFLAMPFPKDPNPKPGYNLFVFLAILIPGLIVSAIFLFPAWFGFKKTSKHTKNYPVKNGKYPFWFWIGVPLVLIGWIVMWGQFSWLGRAVHYTFVPMAWGVILTNDGFVYKRTGGNSLLGARPHLLFAIALLSVPGWYIFQYMNYFLMKNWYYPVEGVFSPLGYHVWHQLGNTTVITGVIEWYCLLGSFDGLRNRYAEGPKVSLAKYGTAFFIIGIVTTVAISIWPIPLFWSVWLGPSFIIGGALLVAGAWTPLNPMLNGDWTAFMLACLAGVCTWLPWEFWNGGSFPANPSFWAYDIPFIEWMPKIGEMPLLGFFGYLPFGLHCIVWFMICAHIFNLSPKLLPDIEQ